MLNEGSLLRKTIVVWIIFEVLAAAQVSRPDGTTVLMSWVRSAIRPVADAGRCLSTAAGDLCVGLSDSRQLASDNSRLRDEVERLATAVMILGTDLEAVLQAEAGLAALPRFDMLPARCVFRDLSTGQMQVVLREPAPTAIRLDMPVVGPGGVVGRVFRIDDPGTCWVQMVTHPAAAVAVGTSDGDLRGLAEGTGGPLLTVRFVSRRSAIMVGEILATSGADGIYPPGLPVATVARVRESPAPFLDILAEPCVDLGNLQSVWLVRLGDGRGFPEEVR